MLDRSWPSRPIVLVGLMGVGKSTVGRLLAARLGHPLVDSDRQLAARHGATARELAESRGLDALHELEVEVLAEALHEAGADGGAGDGDRPTVIAAAAATVLDDAIATTLAATAVVVWLQATPATLAARVPGGPHRPGVDLPAEELALRVAEAATARDPRYATIADVSVVSEDRPPAEVVDEVVAALDAAR